MAGETFSHTSPCPPQKADRCAVMLAFCTWSANSLISLFIALGHSFIKSHLGTIGVSFLPSELDTKFLENKGVIFFIIKSS